MSSYDVTAESTAPPAAVWALLLDTTTWPTWSRVDEARADGSLRTFRTGKVITEERVTTLDPERRFAYEGIVNPHLTNYQAAVELTELPTGGTRIRWHGTYQTRWWMSWFLPLYLRRFMLTMATGLAEHAAKIT
ncbi:hypothetical protein JOD54_004602 [Actinokineospora baliensis]|uniref:SRPBCC family protein n=1 Tax=Actinokineospora baliensis TaxID=547056 RepID=UPI001959FB5A|nr:SRPBCC family protein [Actinokineospora baliensis]MBM7774398.1 hypothetical protein [Actinokineospora baliensis]